MDWTLAIDRNREALLRIVAGLVVVLERAGLRRQEMLSVLRVLRPAEAALRRLIAIMARDVAVPPRPVRERLAKGAARKSGVRSSSFRLFDPRKRINLGRGGASARFSVIGVDDPAWPVPMDSVVKTQALERRLRAVHHALADIPAQAQRLARALARRGQRYLRPMRPGKPPGHRARGKDEIDRVLAECHALALYALHPPEP